MITSSFVCENCKHHNIIRPKRKPRAEQTLYEFISAAFNLLQEPKNKYELIKLLPRCYISIQPFLDEHLSIGNIEQLSYNPNKYMLTMKGRHVLYLVKKLNEFITVYESDIKIPVLKRGRK